MEGLGEETRPGGSRDALTMAVESACQSITLEQHELAATGDESPTDSSSISNSTKADAEAFVEQLLCPGCRSIPLWPPGSAHASMQRVSQHCHEVPSCHISILHGDLFVNQQNQHQMNDIPEAERPLEILKNILRDVNPRVRLLPAQPWMKREWCHFVQLGAFHGADSEKGAERWQFEPRPLPWKQTQLDIISHPMVHMVPNSSPLAGLKIVKEYVDIWGTIVLNGSDWSSATDGCIKDVVESMNGRLPAPR